MNKNEILIKENNNRLMSFVRESFMERLSTYSNRDRCLALLLGFPKIKREEFNHLLFELGINNPENVDVKYKRSKYKQEFIWYYNSKDIQESVPNVKFKDLKSQIWQILVGLDIRFENGGTFIL